MSNPIMSAVQFAINCCSWDIFRKAVEECSKFTTDPKPTHYDTWLNIPFHENDLSPEDTDVLISDIIKLYDQYTLIKSLGDITQAKRVLASIKHGDTTTKSVAYSRNIEEFDLDTLSEAVESVYKVYLGWI